MATHHQLLLLPGDGIGPEVMTEVERIVAFFNKTSNKAKFKTSSALVGGAAIDEYGVPVTEQVMEQALETGAVLFGAVGGPKWDKVAYDIRPEAALLRLRKDLDLFANLRPAICYPALAEASSLKRELVEGLDIMILRELTGGTYFGEPKEVVTLENGEKRAVDTTVYTTHEIERIARVAFDLARKRRNKVHSAEKRNVMRTGVLWNEVVTATHKAHGKGVELNHILADACAMQLVRAPKQFDVIVTDNLFGDMLSDEAAMLTGSIGMLPSASISGPDKSGRARAMYEPVHGSAPDIAGQGKANPIACIASFGMALRYSFDLAKEADLIDKAISNTLAQGLRTGDIMQPNMRAVGTAEMGQAILTELGGWPPEATSSARVNPTLAILAVNTGCRATGLSGGGDAQEGWMEQGVAERLEGTATVMTTEFPELTFANPGDPWLKRAVIHAIEKLSGRDYFVPLYKLWKADFVGRPGRVIGPIFDLINVKLDIVRGEFPPKLEPDKPLIIIANHPFGLIDGLGALALAEACGRPFKILINKDIMKVPEIRPYSLPVDFDDTRAAREANIAMRKDALQLLKDGTTIVIFPSGGVATSPDPFGRAVDLPWKTFISRMIMASRAQVLPVYFEGQCGPLFQAVSWLSLTLRLSLIIREFRKLVGSRLNIRVGALIASDELARQKDRIALMNDLYDRVHALGDMPLDEARARMDRLPAYLRGSKE